MQLHRRTSGVLLHPTSLPGPDGAGDLGPAAERFLEWLAGAGQHVWQMLPLGPTDEGGSPYSSPSAFAGNPSMISVEHLQELGLLDRPPLAAAPIADAAGPAEFARAQRIKSVRLRAAWRRFRLGAPAAVRDRFESFIAQPRTAAWLDDWALFASLKSRHGGRSWHCWPAAVRFREPRALRRAMDQLADEVGFHRFVQFLFDSQLRRLERAAARHEITLLGDMPFYVAYDSADVWAHPELYRLDDERRPIVVSGVPPDYFSETGQLWGNPIFDWRRMQLEGYEWWVARVRRALEQTDVVRLDHFRAFAGFWEVPASHETALDGRWVTGPGRGLFDALERALGRPLPLVAEDLGVITDDVQQLRDSLGLAGMRILQFGVLDPTSEHTPSRFPESCVAYTGTHDNAPLRGWLGDLNESDRLRALAALGATEEDAAWRGVEIVCESRARLAILPMQDLLGLGNEARMNLPGVSGANWSWRVDPSAFTAELARRMMKLAQRTDRANGVGERGQT